MTRTEKVLDNYAKFFRERATHVRGELAAAVNPDVVERVSFDSAARTYDRVAEVIERRECGR